MLAHIIADLDITAADRIERYGENEFIVLRAETPKQLCFTSFLCVTGDQLILTVISGTSGIAEADLSRLLASFQSCEPAQVP